MPVTFDIQYLREYWALSQFYLADSECYTHNPCHTQTCTRNGISERRNAYDLSVILANFIATSYLLLSTSMLSYNSISSSLRDR